jgi:hypothetical protein
VGNRQGIFTDGLISALLLERERFAALPSSPPTGQAQRVGCVKAARCERPQGLALIHPTLCAACFNENRKGLENLQKKDCFILLFCAPDVIIIFFIDKSLGKVTVLSDGLIAALTSEAGGEPQARRTSHLVKCLVPAQGDGTRPNEVSAGNKYISRKNLLVFNI